MKNKDIKDWDKVTVQVLFPFDIVSSPGFSGAKFELEGRIGRIKRKIKSIWKGKTQF
jgi:hypothetical protein